jgi:hypothetical protein
MVRSERNWARTFVRRGLVAAIMVLALAIYGLVSAGTQSLSLKPTAAPTGTAGRSVAMALSPTNGSVNVATQGPNHTLYFFWEVSGTWYGPLGLGAAGSTWSAPAIVAETGPNNGNFDIAVQGPNHTLDFYWDISGTWYGPFGAGAAGTTFSTPALVQDTSHNLQIAAEGPNNSLNVFWNVNAQFYGPLGVGGFGTTFSGPALATPINMNSADTSDVNAWAQGPNHVAREWTRHNNSWQTPVGRSSDNMVYSSVTIWSTTFRASFQGPNNSLWDTEGDISCCQQGPNQIEGAGTTYSVPSEVGPTVVSNVFPGPGDRYIAVEGPSNTLYFYFPQPNSSHNGKGSPSGPLGIGSPGSTFSAPVVIIDSNGNQDIVAQGPSHTLWAYFDIAGVIHGPLQVGGPGSSYSSDN